MFHGLAPSPGVTCGATTGAITGVTTGATTGVTNIRKIGIDFQTVKCRVQEVWVCY